MRNGFICSFLLVVLPQAAIGQEYQSGSVSNNHFELHTEQTELCPSLSKESAKLHKMLYGYADKSDLTGKVETNSLRALTAQEDGSILSTCTRSEALAVKFSH